MKLLRLALVPLVLWMCVAVYGQSSVKPDVNPDAQAAAFILLKTLAGNWLGSLTSDNPAFSTDKPMHLSIRVTSRGNALIHELNTGNPEITMFYMENGQLALVHYCDFGNRPHMVARPSRDGKVVEFDLTDYPGGEQIGHVSHGVFTIIDSSHHVEDWTFLPTGGKPVHAHIDFKRMD